MKKETLRKANELMYEIEKIDNTLERATKKVERPSWWMPIKFKKNTIHIDYEFQIYDIEFFEKIKAQCIEYYQNKLNELKNEFIKL